MEQDRTAATIRRSTGLDVFTTDRTLAMMALAALGALVLLRLLFKGALGD